VESSEEHLPNKHRRGPSTARHQALRLGGKSVRRSDAQDDGFGEAKNTPDELALMNWDPLHDPRSQRRDLGHPLCPQNNAGGN